MKLSRGKRLHLLWLVSPQGQRFGSIEALRAHISALRAEMKLRYGRQKAARAAGGEG